MAQKILEVNIASEFDQGPEVAVVEITDRLASRICYLAFAAKTLGAYGITEFDSSPDFYLRDYEAENEKGSLAYREAKGEDEENICRVECVTLNVTPDDYYWSGYVKHTSIRWETESVPVPESVKGKPILAVVLEGGLVQSIVSNRPQMLAGWDVLVVDYDTDGEEPDSIVPVSQSDTRANAFTRHETIEAADFDLEGVINFLKK